LLTWGEGKFGQLGTGDKNNQPTAFRVPALYNIKEVACGWKHTLCLSNDGRLFSFGDNKYGQLGLADPSPIQLTPRVVESLIDKNVTQISCGWNHSAALTTSGELYLFGRGNYGQLGQGNTINGHLSKPTLLNPTFFNGEQIISFACGSEHTIILTKNKKSNITNIYSFGWNEHGQLGTGDTEDKLEPLIPFTSTQQLISVGSGYGHSFAIHSMS